MKVRPSARDVCAGIGVSLMGNAVALRHELNLDDLVELNKFHFRASLRFWRWVVISVGLMVVVFLGLKRDWSLEA